MTVETLFQSVGPELYILFQAVIALVLGGVLGWEREAAGKWAGLRTHMLVCLSAMLFVKVGQLLIDDSQRTLDPNTLRTDPVRIIEAIVAGIAFLGAGTVFRDPDATKARGLTTAALLLVVAPIGVAVAIERYVLAVGTTLFALFVLRVMLRFEVAMDSPRDKKLPDG
ncbi:MAG TPA: MgtC/SapB family protein [Herpetosiphonaceae bacterium]